MKMFLALSLTIVLVSVPVFAQEPTIPDHPRNLFFEPLEFEPPSSESHRHTLVNGGTAFVVEDHALPLVNVSVLVRTGSYLDPLGKVGLAALTGSQMRAGGTASSSAADFDEETAFLAAQIGSSIGNTMGQANLNCLTKDFDVAMDLFFDMLRYPRFEQTRLSLAKSLLLQSMERRNDSTRSIEGREWGRLMRGDQHFSTQPATRVSLESITRDDLEAFHRRYFHPGNFIFAVSGDVDSDKIVETLNTYLADWPVLSETVPEVPRPLHEPLRGLHAVDKSDVNQGRVSIGHLGVMRENSDRYPLIVMNDILGGGGFSSRLLTRIRSDEGLAYSVGSSFGMGTYYEGVFRVAFQSRSETVARATAIVLEEIERIRNEPVSDDELSNSIASFVDTFTRNFSSPDATVNLFARDEYTGRDPDYLIHYRSRISAVTGRDVLRVAQEYLHPDKLAILVVGDMTTIESGDPENPEYSLAGAPATRIPLPDPFTMEYPSH